MTEPDLERLLASIRPTSAEAADRAARALDDKTKPPGSLGRIEELAIRLAAIHRGLDFRTAPRAVVVMAADHGVVAQGVSAYPREVTAQMVHNFAAGGAAINVLARQMDVRTVVVDIGVAGSFEWPAAVRRCKVSEGTADMTQGSAMTPEQALAAVGVGVDLARELVAGGIELVVTGDMGIGNTTAAAALAAVFTGRSPAEVTGRGTGVDPNGLARKVAAVTRALEVNRPESKHPLEALARVGGLEIAGLCGLILGAAAAAKPVVVDGFIAGAAALVASALAPGARDYLIAGHRSAEAGHGHILAALGIAPLLDLGLRLGEGTGAVLALPLVDAAEHVLHEMASFESAGVSRR